MARKSGDKRCSMQESVTVMLALVVSARRRYAVERGDSSCVPPACLNMFWRPFGSSSSIEKHCDGRERERAGYGVIDRYKHVDR